MTNENNRNHGTYEVFSDGEIIERREGAGFHEVSDLYVNFHGVEDYEVRKISD